MSLPSNRRPQPGQWEASAVLLWVGVVATVLALGITYAAVKAGHALATSTHTAGPVEVFYGELPGDVA